jgi:hypothetical protein
METGYRYSWLLWLAAAAITVLPPFGQTPFLALAIAVLLVLIWVGLNVSPKNIFVNFFMAIMEVFFREMGHRNQ